MLRSDPFSVVTNRILCFFLVFMGLLVVIPQGLVQGKEMERLAFHDLFGIRVHMNVNFSGVAPFLDQQILHSEDSTKVFNEIREKSSIKDQLQGDVERRLRRADILVLPDSDKFVSTFPSNDGNLYIDVKVKRKSSPFDFDDFFVRVPKTVIVQLSIELRRMRKVNITDHIEKDFFDLIKRGPKPPLKVWSAKEKIESEWMELYGTLARHIGNHIDHFIELHRSANPD